MQAMKFPALPPWMLIAGAVAAFGAWTATVYLAGAQAGRDDVTAAQAPALLATLDQAAKDAGALQKALGDLSAQAGAVQTAVAAVTIAADEAEKRLADAGVMAASPPFTERDIRLLNAEIDRLEAAAGLSGR
jgi:hypothetical protein